MVNQIDEFRYSDVYGCWDGKIKVKCSAAFFGQDEIEIAGHMDSKDSLPVEAHNTLCYIKAHFDEVYENILEGLFELQSKGLKYEKFNENDLSFTPITFQSKEDIHPYLGPPAVEILHRYTKENQAYFAISFFKNCQLSIEHGLTAIVHQSDIIEISPSETQSILERIESYEEDCTKWQKGFGLVFFEMARNRLLNDRALLRTKWLK